MYWPLVNSAALNIGVHISFQIMIFSRCMPRSEVVDHMVALSFLRTSLLFSIVAASTYISTV